MFVSVFSKINTLQISKFFLFIILALNVFTIGCEKDVDMKPINEQEIANIEVMLNKISNDKFVFGHASVGKNIVKGIEDILLKYNHNNKFVIRDIESNPTIQESGFYHFKVRKNGFPLMKIDSFVKTLGDNNLGSKVNTAFFKLCYVDIEDNTNIDEIFDKYVTTMAEIKEKYPSLRIIHVTTPLYSHRYGIKGYIKRMLKPDSHNIKRNEYNQMLISKYQGIDPIFDLAKVESTLPNGQRTTFKFGEKSYYALANQYTSDGGHLNEIGRYYAAKELLKVLSENADN